jgi:glycosyltransferase involved in cell wall biosynthesis
MSNTNKVVISVIVPIFNEEKLIGELYNRLAQSVGQLTQNYELIFVNDGSTDHSLFEILKLSENDERVLYINFSRNFGHQIAVTAGLDACKGKAVVIIDGDLQDPPELIPELYQKHQEGFEVVYAKRKSRKGENFFKRFTAKAFYRILKAITSIDIPIDNGDYRLIDKKVVHYLRQMPEQNKFLRGQIAWIGFKQTQVYFDREKRKYGKTNYSLGKMLHFAMDGITSFSDVPLKIVTRLGFLISFVAFLIIFYASYSHFVLRETISGWTSLIMSATLIGGVQLISIGIIGEYLSRINKNVLNRPLYIVEKTNIVEEGQEEKEA